MSSDALEQRVAALEREVREMKAQKQPQLFSPANPNPNWVAEVAGSMKDSPEFDEVRSILREMRAAERAQLDRNASAQ